MHIVYHEHKRTAASQKICYGCSIASTRPVEHTQDLCGLKSAWAAQCYSMRSLCAKLFILSPLKLPDNPASVNRWPHPAKPWLRLLCCFVSMRYASGMETDSRDCSHSLGPLCSTVAYRRKVLTEFASMLRRGCSTISLIGSQASHRQIFRTQRHTRLFQD